MPSHGANDEDLRPRARLAKHLLKKIKKSLGLTTREIADRADIAPSLVSLIENSKVDWEPTQDSLRKISAAFGLDERIWGIEKPYQDHCTVLIAEEFEAAKALMKMPLRAPARPSLRWKPNKPGSKEGQYVQYEAHRTMIDRTIYRFITMQDIDAEYSRRPDAERDYVRFPANLILQPCLFEIRPCNFDDVFLDAHIGQEAYYLLEGRVSFAVMAEPNISGTKAFVGSKGKTSQIRMKIEPAARETVLKEHEDVELPDGFFTPIQFGASKDPLHYEVDAVVYELEAGSSLTLDSTWPHAGFILPTEADPNPRPALMHMVSHGSFVGSRS